MTRPHNAKNQPAEKSAGQVDHFKEFRKANIVSYAANCLTEFATVALKAMPQSIKKIVPIRGWVKNERVYAVILLNNKHFFADAITGALFDADGRCQSSNRSIDPSRMEPADAAEVRKWISDMPARRGVNDPSLFDYGYNREVE